jgi:hypothetical protein
MLSRPGTLPVTISILLPKSASEPEQARKSPEGVTVKYDCKLSAEPNKCRTNLREELRVWI